MSQAVTFEEIDRGMRELDLSLFEGSQFAAADAAAHISLALAISKLAPLYRAVRPLLEALATTPLIPAKWKEVLRLFIAAIDAICRLAAFAVR